MNVLVPASDGCEEIETISIIDVLRRANANVTFASIKPVTQELPLLNGQSGIKLVCDDYFYNILGIDYDMIVLPGGLQNAESLSNNQELIHKIKIQKEQKKWLAAICASPAIVFEKHNILDNEYATCHPSLQDLIKNKQLMNERVVISNKIITSRAPGTALEFSLALVEVLFGTQKATQLAKSMLIRR